MELKNFISTYEKGTVQVTDSVSYDLRDVINENYRVFNSKFQDNAKESNGFTKIFYNIAWILYRRIIMAADIDLKDINIRALNSKGVQVVSIVRMSLYSYLMRTFFGTFIDECLSRYTWFGSTVTKRVKGKVYNVDLRNYVTETTIKDPQKRRHAEYFNKPIQETIDEYKNHERAEDIKKLGEKILRTGGSAFKIIEYWTFGKPKGEKGIHKMCQKYLDASQDEKPERAKSPTEWSPHILLEEFITPYKKRRESESERKEYGEYEEMFPYEQADFFDAPGRWLSFGCGELLIGISEHYNEKHNLYRKKDILDLRGIFVHKFTNSSNSLTQEFLNNFETGDLMSMNVDEDLQRLVIDTKTGEFIAHVDKLYELARLILGVTDDAPAEDLPSQTATAAVIQKQGQQTTYDYVRERMNHFIVRLFRNGLLEDILKEISKEDVVAILGGEKELEELDRFFVENLANDESERLYQETGEYPDPAQAEEEKQNALAVLREHGDTRFVQLREEILKQLEFITEVFVNNEGFDRNTKVQNLQTMLADPNFTGSRREVESVIFDLIGENPNQFNKTEEEKAEEQARIQAEQAGMTPPPPIEETTPPQEAFIANNAPAPTV